MSGGTFCRCEKPDRRNWRVTQRNCNHSAFSGYHFTPSDYSAISCLLCHSSWRTKAGYVDSIPDISEGERRR